MGPHGGAGNRRRKWRWWREHGGVWSAEWGVGTPNPQPSLAGWTPPIGRVGDGVPSVHPTAWGHPKYPLSPQTARG